jgi:hypothetical protein
MFVVRVLAEQTSVVTVRICLPQIPLSNVMRSSSLWSYSVLPRLCGRDAG